jgi:ribonuclease H / adenosylcobalamin/alpha-ribazole phosphatase
MVANPGPASYAAVVLDAESGDDVMVANAVFGESASNAAEYRGVIAGLAVAAQLAPGEPVEVRLISEVVIFQMAGRRRGKDPDLRSLRDEAMRIAKAFPAVVFTKTTADDTARVYQLTLEALGTDLHDARQSGARTGMQPRLTALRPLRRRPHGTGQRGQAPEERTCGDLERCAALSCSVS